MTIGTNKYYLCNYITYISNFKSIQSLLIFVTVSFAVSPTIFTKPHALEAFCESYIYNSSVIPFEIILLLHFSEEKNMNLINLSIPLTAISKCFSQTSPLVYIGPGNYFVRFLCRTYCWTTLKNVIFASIAK